MTLKLPASSSTLRQFAGCIRHLCTMLIAAAFWFFLAIAQADGEHTGIAVNGVELSIETVQALRQIYPVEIARGHYWYDKISGAWGRDGEPVAGQMLAGLELGGPLRADASRGTAGVFINGRQITKGEKAFLEQLCQSVVAPGRYWILFNGIGGYEGGPASFNLRQCPGFARSSGGGRSMSKTYCDAGGNCTSTGVLGYISTTP
jgi:hypothetical protein